MSEDRKSARVGGWQVSKQSFHCLVRGLEFSRLFYLIHDVHQTYFFSSKPLQGAQELAHRIKVNPLGRLTRHGINRVWGDLPFDFACQSVSADLMLLQITTEI